ncbi:MAG: dihydroorotate dehydrogenase electron transfer subunit [Rhodospirillales bacterium]|nr:dihydroorotate dehydrogenase electron transfer subunit [Rhodospirillales bacterium]
MTDFVSASKYAASPDRVGEPDRHPDRPAGEFICNVLSNEWVNGEYKLLALETPPRALNARAGQFFHLLCPTPDGAEVWMRRPMSVYRIDKEAGHLQFLYKCEGRGTQGMALLEPGDEFNIAGPFGIGFHLDPAWKNIVVLGRGVGLATLAPLAQMAAENGVHVTAILSARSAELVMSRDMFDELGADVIEINDTDHSSDVDNVEAILEKLIADGRADAFFTCGSNRLLDLMKRLGEAHGVPGQVAMEQIMACGLGACYICVRTFEVNGEKILRRVCREGPVFDIQETVGW